MNSYLKTALAALPLIAVCSTAQPPKVETCGTISRRDFGSLVDEMRYTDLATKNRCTFTNEKPAYIETQNGMFYFSDVNPDAAYLMSVCDAMAQEFKRCEQKQSVEI